MIIEVIMLIEVKLPKYNSENGPTLDCHVFVPSQNR